MIEYLNVSNPREKMWLGNPDTPQAAPVTMTPSRNALDPLDCPWLPHLFCYREKHQ